MCCVGCIAPWRLCCLVCVVLVAQQQKICRHARYTVQSDVWSLGLSVFELATAQFPITGDGGQRQLAFFELLQLIVNGMSRRGL